MDPWRMFRIMAEFVDGFEQMTHLGPGVSIFGSARTKEDHPHYQMARTTAKLLAESGFNVITGGGPGIMEAANRGASESGKGTTVGLNIDLPFEQTSNPYIQKLLNFRYFFVRKVMFSKYSHAIITMPGGFGTLDEFFENITLVQTRKVNPMPMVLMGKDFWSGLLDWIKEKMLDDCGMISPEDVDLFLVTDDPKEAVEYVIREIGKQGLVGEHHNR